MPITYNNFEIKRKKCHKWPINNNLSGFYAVGNISTTVDRNFI